MGQTAGEKLRPSVPMKIRQAGQNAIAAYAAWMNKNRSIPALRKPSEVYKQGTQYMGQAADQKAQQLSPRYKEMVLDKRIEEVKRQLAQKPVDGGEL